MEEQYLLKKHGNYSIFELDQMTAEERLWVLKRIETDYKKEEQLVNQQSKSKPKIPQK